LSARRRSKTAVLREHALLAAVLSQPTLTRAAAAGVNERTVRRALKRPGFSKKVTEARKAAIASALSSLSGLAADAHDAIRRALTCGVPAVELKAGLAVLMDGPIRGGELLFGLEELAELREQVAKLIELDQQEGQQ
jgi:hypothetical protein